MGVVTFYPHNDKHLATRGVGPVTCFLNRPSHIIHSTMWTQYAATTKCTMLYSYWYRTRCQYWDETARPI